MATSARTSNLVIYRVEPDEIQDIYPRLFQQIFTKLDPAHVPGFIYIGLLDGQYIGFISAYRHKADTVYCQYGGFIDLYRGFKAFSLLRQVLEAIHEEFRFIILHVENQNIAALKLFMKVGFRIIGTHVATDQTIYVELIKEK